MKVKGDFGKIESADDLIFRPQELLYFREYYQTLEDYPANMRELQNIVTSPVTEIIGQELRFLAAEMKTGEFGIFKDSY